METAERRVLRLARLGFADAERAGTLLGPAPDGLGLWADGDPADGGAAAVVSALGRAADPDLALLALSRIAEPDLLAALRADPVLRRRLVAEGWDVDAALARWDLDTFHADLEEVWRPFANRFAELVRRS